jgi:SSS family transporter
MPRPLAFRFVLLLLLAAFVPGLASEQLTKLRIGELPSLPADAGESLFAQSGGTTFAIRGGRAWVASAEAWAETPLRAPAPIVATAFGTAYVLLGATSVSSEDAAVLEAVALGAVALTGDGLGATHLVDLPRPVRSPSLAVWRDTLYVVGLDERGKGVAWRRALRATAPAWSELSDVPLEATTLSGAVVQDASFYVLAREGSAGSLTRWLRWRDEGGWASVSALRDVPITGTLRPLGQAHVLVLGAGDAGGRVVAHVYHTITDTWTEFGSITAGDVVNGLAWGNGAAFLRRDSADSEFRVQTVEIEMSKRLLHAIDWLVIVAYLAGMAGIGLMCWMREKRSTTADYFVGGRSIPFWAAGLSLYATGTSAISYIAIPAKSFATDWLYLAQNVVGLLATVFVAIWIVPLIRRLNIMSVYQYLEMRFHPSIRMLASGLNIVLQLGGRMSVVLFLPSLAVSAVTGVDVVTSICVMGVITILYTVMGGMKAVIWTDVIQVFVMLGGAFFAIGYVVLSLDGGVSEFFATAAADDKMRVFDLRWDLTRATVWGFVFLALLDVLTYPKDQVMMQRVLSTKSAKAAGWSVWTLAAVVVPGSLTFYAIGTALFAFYKHHPEKLNPLLTIDATFPHFIAAELPVGVTGLIIAGIFAASMSTLSSCINSVATLVSVDFYEKLAKKPDPKKSVRIAEVLTVVAGLIGVGTAILLSFFDIRSFFDLSLELAGLLGGGFAGTYALGMFTRRANWQGAAIGVCTSIGVTMVAWSMRLVHSFFYTAIAIFTCIVVGYVASLFFPVSQRSLDGLTIYGRSRQSRDSSQT